MAFRISAPRGGADRRYRAVTSLEERFITVDGRSCRVWEQGSGERVGYFSGLGGLPRWTPFLAALAKHRRVVTVSLPGFPGGGEIGLLDTHFDWLLAAHDLLDGAGLQGSDLVGVSIGGALAADLAAVWPEMVRRLVLVSPLGLFDSTDPTADIFAQPLGKTGELLCAHPANYEAHMAVPDGGDTVEWAVSRVRADEAAARILWPIGDTGLARRLHRIVHPTLLVFGTEDRVVPRRYHDRFLTGISGECRLELIEGAGHLADLDEPAQVAATIAAFLG